MNTDNNMNIMSIDNTETNDTTESALKIRLTYTPPPISEETRKFIASALAVPPNIPSSPYDMSNDTHALLDIILHMAALRKSSSRQGTVTYT